MLANIEKYLLKGDVNFSRNEIIPNDQPGTKEIIETPPLNKYRKGVCFLNDSILRLGNF